MHLFLIFCTYVGIAVFVVLGLLILFLLGSSLWWAITTFWMLKRARAVAKRQGYKQDGPSLGWLKDFWRMLVRGGELQVDHVVIPRNPFKRLRLAPR